MQADVSRFGLGGGGGAEKQQGVNVGRQVLELSGEQGK